MKSTAKLNRLKTKSFWKRYKMSISGNEFNINSPVKISMNILNNFSIHETTYDCTFSNNDLIITVWKNLFQIYINVKTLAILPKN